MRLSIFVIIITCWASNMALAQGTMKPHDLVKQATQSDVFISVSPFSTVQNRNDVQLPEDIQEYTLLDVRRERDAKNMSSNYIELTIPQQARQDIVLQLVAYNSFLENTQITLATSNTSIPINKGKHYRGIIKGQPMSVAAISIFEDEIMGFVAHPMASGNLIIGKLDDSPYHILYQDHQLSHLKQNKCATEDNLKEYSREELSYDIHSGTRDLNDCVRFYLEVDHDIYQNKGSSSQGVTNFITGLFNQVSTLYANEQINTAISEIYIWDQPSPYNATTSTGMLNAFTAYRQGFNGDLAMLLSYKASGGVAYLDGLCRSNPDYSMSYSGISSAYQNVPTYSWSVEVCTHEFGHLMGSQHTHACVWNGNNTAIDGCYTTEGSCPNPGLPPVGTGTIMSYCHLTNVGINFSIGFGLQPGNVMRSEVSAANCLTPCGNGGGGGGTCTENTLTLQIQTDNYPAETTWAVYDNNGQLLYAGGPYTSANTLHSTTMCLTTACFTFTINDSYGDGICCGYGSGYYTINEGSTTLVSGGQFGTTQTHSFCAGGGNNGPTCSDGIQNGNETGIDCGGPDCAPCASCTDGIQNNGETGIDCGGPNCSPCPTCADGIQNGGETGIDCGGPDCAPCNGGNGPTVTPIAGYYFETGWQGWQDGGSDCFRYAGSLSPEGVYSIRIRDNSGIGSAMTSPSHNVSDFDYITIAFQYFPTGFEDNESFLLLMNNGSGWTTLKSYVLGTDFVNDILHSASLQISTNLTANTQFRLQADASDNSDNVYIDAVIITGYVHNNNNNPTCADGIQNGNETGIDCGGPDCAPCASCTDGIQNNGETGIDCGGPNCSPCPTCADGIQNGSETGIDCGGPDCAPCNGGGSSTVIFGHYFESGWDSWIDGGGDCFRYFGSLSPEGSYSIRLRDNSGLASAMTSSSYDLSGYNGLTLAFQFYADGMESGEDFFVQYYNGNVWTTLATLVADVNFSNGTMYTVTVNLSGGPFSSNSQFRIQCDASDNSDIVYIDGVELTGHSGTNSIENTISIIPLNQVFVDRTVSEKETSWHVYPNPADDKLFIQADEDIIESNIYDFNGRGVMKSIHSAFIDISLLPPGMYIIECLGEDSNYKEKFIKK